MYRIFTSTEQLMRHPLMRKDESTDTESGPFSQVPYTKRLLYLLCPCVPRCETGTVKLDRHLMFCREFSGPFSSSWVCPKNGVADPGCLSRILIIIYPESRILDSGSNNNNKREGWKMCCPTCFCSHEYHKIVNYFIFEQAKKNI